MSATCPWIIGLLMLALFSLSKACNDDPYFADECEFSTTFNVDLMYKEKCAGRVFHNASCSCPAMNDRVQRILKYAGEWGDRPFFQAFCSASLKGMCKVVLSVVKVRPDINTKVADPVTGKQVNGCQWTSLDGDRYKMIVDCDASVDKSLVPLDYVMPYMTINTEPFICDAPH